ncbi:MAG: hypothetical protein M1142_01715 [Patescibacteria group bacterium]|nr:hypothetical protein [Patescibacteria group bacterium]
MDYSNLKKDFNKRIIRFNKVIIWGLKNQNHTHRYIHHHFYTTLNKLGAKTAWVDDNQNSQQIIEKGDIIIGVGIAGNHLPIKSDVYYCLHNFDDSVYRQIEPSKNIRLQVYTKGIVKEAQKWNEVTFFDKKNKILYQPWGTNLLPNEFKEPVVPTISRLVFWIGSIWSNDLNQGNLKEIEKLKKVLKKHGLYFIPLHRIPDFLNTSLVRISRIAPAIAGQWQVEHDYLPCRMWKNISYGQLGISNVKKFHDVFKGCSVDGETIEELIENALNLTPRQVRDLIFNQQKITRNHTYVNSLNNIMKAFEVIE